MIEAALWSYFGLCALATITVLLLAFVAISR